MKQLADGLDARINKLRYEWESAKSVWDDPVSNDFEDKYILPMFDQLHNVQCELSQMIQIIYQAKSRIK